jgi:pteridine reductase
VRPTAVVTGAAKRVGRAIAVSLAEGGYDVCVHYRRSAGAAEETAEACRAFGADAFCVAADLGQAAGCATLVEAVRDRWSSLALLVNNASLFAPTPFEQIDDAALMQMLEVNLVAPFRLSRDLLPLLRADGGFSTTVPQGQHGVVVHLCDIGAKRPVRGYAHYSVSKAGLVMLVRAMAVELAPAVRTVGISPGQVAWPDDYDPATRAQLTRRIPMGRAGSPQDVAGLVRFVAREGHYLNGVVLPVDGGLSARY